MELHQPQSLVFTLYFELANLHASAMGIKYENSEVLDILIEFTLKRGFANS